jgi:ubiquinone biosynthesis protein UbiJ
MNGPLSALHAMLAPALMARLSLLINHVLGREPVAMERLRPHAGRLILVAVEDRPAWLPPPPLLAWRVTPAGLLEWCPKEAEAGADAADLQVRLTLGSPWQRVMELLSGQRPPVRVEGDAALAGTVDWLFGNLRWDVADDVQRLMGPLAAQGLADAASGVRQALAACAARFAPPAGFGGGRG